MALTGFDESQLIPVDEFGFDESQLIPVEDTSDFIGPPPLTAEQLYRINRRQQFASELAAEEAKPPARAFGVSPEGGSAYLTGGLISGTGKFLRGLGTIEAAYKPEAGYMGGWGPSPIPISPKELRQNISKSALVNLGANIQKIGEEGKPSEFFHPEEESSLSAEALRGTGEAIPAIGATMVNPTLGALVIGGQSIGGSDIEQDVKDLSKSGISEEEAFKQVMSRLLASGASQASIWSILPAPLRKLGDQLVAKAGGNVLKAFAYGRLAQSAEGMALGASSKMAENVSEGKPITEDVGESAAKLAIPFLMMPRGGIAREPSQRPLELPQSVRDPNVILNDIQRVQAGQEFLRKRIAEPIEETDTAAYQSKLEEKNKQRAALASLEQRRVELQQEHAAAKPSEQLPGQAPSVQIPSPASMEAMRQRGIGGTGGEPLLTGIPITQREEKRFETEPIKGEYTPHEQSFVDIGKGRGQKVIITDTMPEGTLTGALAVEAGPGKVYVDRNVLRRYGKGRTAEKMRDLIESTLDEEQIHDVTPPDVAREYYDNMTDIEKKLKLRRYAGPKAARERAGLQLSPEQQGKEALRFDFQKLKGMTPREILEAKGMEWLTVHGITALERSIAAARRFWGTNASTRQTEILNEMTERLGAARQRLGLPPSTLQKPEEKAAALPKGQEDETLKSPEGKDMPRDEMDALIRENPKGYFDWLVSPDGTRRRVFRTKKFLDGKERFKTAGEFYGKIRPNDGYPEAGQYFESDTRAAALPKYTTKEEVDKVEPDKFIADLKATSYNQLNDVSKDYKGGYTSWLLDVGEKFRNPEGIAKLKQAWTEEKAKAASLQRARKMAQLGGDQQKANDLFAQWSDVMGRDQAWEEILEGALNLKDTKTKVSGEQYNALLTSDRPFTSHEDAIKWLSENKPTVPKQKAAALSKEELAQPEDDVDKYNKLQARFKELIAAGQYDTPEFQQVWKESEAIKNRHGGFVPTRQEPTKSPQSISEDWIKQQQTKAAETPLGKSSPDAALKVVSEWIRKGSTPEGPIPKDVQEALRRSLSATKDMETGETLDVTNPDWPRTGTLLDFLEQQYQKRTESTTKGAAVSKEELARQKEKEQTKSVTGLPEAFKGMGQAISANLYESMWKRLKAGKYPESVASPTGDFIFDQYKKGNIKRVEDIKDVLVKEEKSNASKSTEPTKPPVPPTKPPETVATAPEAEGARYGIAARVSEERAARGDIPGEPIRGPGISASDAIVRGRKLKASGVDPVKVMETFEKTKAISGDGMAVIRAHGEDLFEEAVKAQRQFGRNSPEYKAAQKADYDWLIRVKRAQTEWHDIGAAQQGETDIDTGSFHGLQRAFFETTGRDFTPQQATKADKLAKTNQEATQVETKAKEDFYKAKDETVKIASDDAKKVWERAKSYIEKGEGSIDDIRHKVATDLGMPVSEVTRLLTETKQHKRMMDDVWKKQEQARRLRTLTKQWLKAQAIPGYLRALSNVPRILFGMKVAFHGTVALGTHAPMMLFQPPWWKTYFKNYYKMYRMVGSPAYFEMQMQDLLRNKNYITGRRAGLQTDPFQYEEYTDPKIAKAIGILTRSGTRGYGVLKLLRQDMFDTMWDRLPESVQTPDMAAAMADGINHVTGVTKKGAPKGAHLALFAPRLMASRAMWLAGDPARAATTILNWKNATPAERQFAVNQVKEKLWVGGTLFGLLAANQGFLSATDSDQEINFTDPNKSDFLKFKVAGMDVAYGNPMITMARLPSRMVKIRDGDTGKLKNVILPDAETYAMLLGYLRSQASPFAGLAADQWFMADYQNRPLPSSNRPVPKRLRQQGLGPYTWPEYLSETLSPIPFQEAIKEVWKTGMGMSDEQIRQYMKALGTIAFQAGTGARVAEDTHVK